MTKRPAQGGAVCRGGWLVAVVSVIGASCSDPLSLSSHRDAGTGRDGPPQADVLPTVTAPTGDQCLDGYAACGKGDGLRCYDLGRSPEHCGACGNACPAGITCQAGSCQQYRCKGALSFKTTVLGSAGAVYGLGDFDGDGILDLVGASDDSPLGMSLLFGAGDGTFPAVNVVDATTPDLTPPALPLNAPWRQALVADVDGDGLMDLTSTRGGQSAVTVRLGSGNRDTPFGDPATYPTATGVTGILLADFDSDGRLDLVAVVGPGLEYRRGQSGGRFDDPTLLGSGDTAPVVGAGNAVAMDWNGDGLLDAVYGLGGLSGAIQVGGSGRLRYRLGHGDGSFDAEVSCALAAGVIGDLDHDHRPDLISASSLIGSSLLLGITSCSASKIVSIADWIKQGGAAMADLDGDGNLDVVVDHNHAIMVQVGDGKGGFRQSLTLAVPGAGDWPMGVLFVGDLNRDGKLDVVFARESGWGALLNTCR